MIGLWLTGGKFFYGEQLERLKGDGLMGENASAAWLKGAASCCPAMCWRNWSKKNIPEGIFTKHEEDYYVEPIKN
jgi:hypothetical protein